MVAIHETGERAVRDVLRETWWAHSAVHGWVVLDRAEFHNRVTHRPDRYEFVRCADWSRYRQGAARWSYQEAERYLAGLPAGEALLAGRELERLRREYAEMVHG